MREAISTDYNDPDSLPTFDARQMGFARSDCVAEGADLNAYIENPL